MDQDSASANKSTISQSVAIRPCELRLERRMVDSDGRERTEFICGAAGGPEHGYVLGVAGEDLSSMIAICNACPIPNALASSRACLNLLPVRGFPGGKQSLPMLQRQNQAVDSKESADVYFPCRWFYTLYGQKQPRDLSVCRSCTHWFLRPLRELIPQYWPETEKMLRIVNGEESVGKAPTGFAPISRRPSAGTWWQHLLEKIHL
ncbi:MAG TPA: hypothetical protein VFA10_06505 [Ktedonobacteraceae bacterium]|nr:hypothetical protein [Ktedonobacteraceae bacterium]